jgi:hypothetical protein
MATREESWVFVDIHADGTFKAVDLFQALNNLLIELNCIGDEIIRVKIACRLNEVLALGDKVRVTTSLPKSQQQHKSMRVILAHATFLNVFVDLNLRFGLKGFVKGQLILVEGDAVFCRILIWQLEYRLTVDLRLFSPT